MSLKMAEYYVIHYCLIKYVQAIAVFSYVYTHMPIRSTNNKVNLKLRIMCSS